MHLIVSRAAILSLLICASRCFAQEFVNPLSTFDAPDPCIVRANGKTYLYSTGYSSWRGAYPIRVSDRDDLSTWTHTGYIFPLENLPSWAEAIRRYWAPEVHLVGNQYICYFSTHDKNGRFCIGAGTSDSPEGPFNPQDKPLVSHPEWGLIDATYYKDPVSGKSYLSWKEDKNALNPQQPTGLLVQELTADGLSLLGEPVTVLQNDTPWEGELVEGASFVYRDGHYYLFYSGNVFSDDRYAVGVARSKSLLGSYVKFSGNPILRADDRFGGPGHQFLFERKPGEWTMFYHARDNQSSESRGRMLMSDPVLWRGDGWPYIRRGVPSRSWKAN